MMITDRRKRKGKRNFFHAWFSLTHISSLSSSLSLTLTLSPRAPHNTYFRIFIHFSAGRGRERNEKYMPGTRRDREGEREKWGMGAEISLPFLVGISRSRYLRTTNPAAHSFMQEWWRKRNLNKWFVDSRFAGSELISHKGMCDSAKRKRERDERRKEFSSNGVYN